VQKKVDEKATTTRDWNKIGPRARRSTCTVFHRAREGYFQSQKKEHAGTLGLLEDVERLVKKTKREEFREERR